MENKQIWLTVLIAFFAGIVGALILAAFTGSGALLGPIGDVTPIDPTPTGGEINANRCQRDSICEVNNLKVVPTNGVIETPFIKATAGTIAHLSYLLGDDIVGQTDFAYACVNKDGGVFRSEVPCVAKPAQYCNLLTQPIRSKLIDIDSRNGQTITRLAEDDLWWIGDYGVLPNNYILKLIQIVNNTGYANDIVKFKDAISGQIYEATITAEGEGILILGGVSYPITLYIPSNEEGNVYFDFPQSPDDEKIDFRPCF